MKDDIIEKIAKNLSNSYYYLLLTAFEKQQHQFPITMTVIEVITKLRENNIVYDLGDIFCSEFIDKMIVEANKYIGK